MIKILSSFQTMNRSLGLATVFVFALFLFVAPAVSHADTLTRQLGLGMSGADVGSLQTFLARDVTLYPQGLVTSFFGSLTKTAVANFQVRNGLPAVGRVGPATLPILNQQMAGGVVVTGPTTPWITGAGVVANRNNASVNWSTSNEVSKGVVYYSTSPLSTYDNETWVQVSGMTAMTDANFRSTQSVALTNLQADTNYYYLIYTTNQMGNVSVTWPATFHTTN